MIKKLTPIGNSLGLIIERPILNLLDIDRDTELEITTDGKMLIIQPMRGAVASNEIMRGDPKEAVSVKQEGKSFLDELRDAFK